MGKPPAFQMYASDFDMDTGSWTNPQVGVYIRLLLYSWVNGSIPNNMAQLSRIARIDVRNMHKMWLAVIAEKWTLTPDNMYVNKRLELEREKQLMYRESQKQKGIKRAGKMWEGHIAAAIPRLQPKHSSSSSSSTLKNKHIEIVLPEWLKKETWEAFIEMRKAKGAKPTNKAVELLITKLDGFRLIGQDPNKILDQSIMHNWTGVFPIKEGGNGNVGIRTNRSDPRDSSLQSREDAEVAAITAKWEADKKAARDNAGRTAGNDDAPDFPGK